MKGNKRNPQKRRKEEKHIRPPSAQCEPSTTMLSSLILADDHIQNIVLRMFACQGFLPGASSPPYISFFACFMTHSLHSSSTFFLSSLSISSSPRVFGRLRPFAWRSAPNFWIRIFDNSSSFLCFAVSSWLRRTSPLEVRTKKSRR